MTIATCKALAYTLATNICEEAARVRGQLLTHAARACAAILFLELSLAVFFAFELWRVIGLACAS